MKNEIGVKHDSVHNLQELPSIDGQNIHKLVDDITSIS
jgi:hypothetical protein